jgi:hypothetical protein
MLARSRDLIAPALLLCLIAFALTGCEYAQAETDDRRDATVGAATVFGYVTFKPGDHFQPEPAPAPAPPRPGIPARLIPSPDPISTPAAPPQPEQQPEQHAAAIAPSIAELLGKHRNGGPSTPLGPAAGDSCGPGGCDPRSLSVWHSLRSRLGFRR